MKVTGRNRIKKVALPASGPSVNYPGRGLAPKRPWRGPRCRSPSGAIVGDGPKPGRLGVKHANITDRAPQETPAGSSAEGSGGGGGERGGRGRAGTRRRTRGSQPRRNDVDGPAGEVTARPPRIGARLGAERPGDGGGNGARRPRDPGTLRSDDEKLTDRDARGGGDPDGLEHSPRSRVAERCALGEPPTQRGWVERGRI